jgi:hypothetical protein
MLLGQPIRQIAYVVKDVREAAKRHSALYGSGPFLVNKTPAMKSIHRGQAGVLELNVAFGQWGTMQVEFMHQINSGPSVLHDLFPEGSGKTGLHHFACIVDDLEGTVDAFKRAGHKEAGRLDTVAGDTVFIDRLADEGYFIELYGSCPMLTGMYETIAKAAVGFDGREPVHDWDFERWPINIPPT